jgi:hypothetical protein
MTFSIHRAAENRLSAVLPIRPDGATLRNVRAHQQLDRWVVTFDKFKKFDNAITILRSH